MLCVMKEEERKKRREVRTRINSTRRLGDNLERATR